MSYKSIHQSVHDQGLIDRIRAAIAKEAWANATLGATPTGQSIKMGGPDMILQQFIWPICIDNEAAYAYALDTAVPEPGSNPDVITDGAIGAGIQAHWP